MVDSTPGGPVREVVRRLPEYVASAKELDVPGPRSSAKACLIVVRRGEARNHGQVTVKNSTGTC